MRRPLALLATLAALTLPALAVPLAVQATAPAHAQGRVSVTNDRGGSEADSTYRTQLTIRGSGFQVVRGGFGGVYVMFGWVDDPSGGSWKPSRGGLTGQDYQYVPDSEDADNQGYLRFIAFPGSSTASEANGVLSASGGFSVDLTVPGPVFQSVDREGQVAEVDCREVTCGVITIGAHGVKNPENETFTPVRFGNVYDSEPAAPTTSEPAESEDADGSGETDAPATPAETPGTDSAAPAASGPAGLTVDRTTAVAGHALAFSAQGFTPGEQVTAVLDDGAAGLGPLVAGASGEIAGVLQLPADLPVGTHELRITGAASGTEVSELFPVAAGDAAVAPVAADADGAGSDDSSAVGFVFLVVAGVVFAVALIGFAFSLLRRRRAQRRPAAGVPA